MIKSENKPVIILISCFVIFFIGFLIFLTIMIVPSKEFKFNLTSKSLNISGKRGTDIELNNIKDIKLLNEAPKIEYNGGGQSGNMMFGHNYMDNLGFTECYINNENGEVIYIKTDNDQFLVGLDNNGETKNLYNELIAKK